MKKNLLYLSYLIGIALCFASCEKAKEPELGSIYGCVTDFATGDPVYNANIQLQPTGESTRTGSDGLFEFLDLEDGDYSIVVSKIGYSDLVDDYIIKIKNGRQVRRDVQIEKLTSLLIVLDEKGNDVTELDFGDNPADVMRSFFIANKGEDNLQWKIEYSCAWIASLNKSEGELKPDDKQQPLVVTIDRNKLNAGENSTTLHIISNGGTKQIVVRASTASIIETLPPTNIRSNSVVLNGKIKQDMSPAITEYGFVYSKTAAPTVENGAVKVSMQGSPVIGAEYNTLISNLDTESWYYARAYATNGTTYVYGEQVSFKTIEGLPEVSTLGSRSVTSSSAIIQCKVTDDAGAEITARGVCYALTPLPDEYGAHTSDGAGVGQWESSLSDLSPNATYYVRAYAKNIYGTGYGEQITITTTEGLAKVVTKGVSAITSNSASCSCEVVSDGDRQVTERGICWSKTPYPTNSGNHTANGSGVGIYTCSMTNLDPGTDYHVRAYATNSAGIVYGEDVLFTTLSEAPAVSTQAASNITSSSAKVSGAITSTGGSPITEAGFIYQAEGDYNTKQVQFQVTSGSFSYELSNLEPDTKYYVKAYARNAKGLGEGAIVNFITASGLPNVSTSSSTSVGSTSATVTGNIISNGGFPITECGICYSKTNKKPTIADDYVASTATAGQYNCELTGLTPSTKYYARAYAKNANGIVYDNTAINFTTTNGMPSIVITQQPTYNGSDATLYGRITSDGGANIEYYGVVYSRSNTQPTIENREAIQYQEGAPFTDDFTFSVTNVPTGTMLYYRFFVVNSLAKVAYSSSGYLLRY